MAARTFQSEDEEAQYCLSTLRDGTPQEKIDARERLAGIFARRGLFEEAAELYELNLRAGVRTAALFDRLAATYRGLGDDASAGAALAEATRIRSAETAARAATPDPTAPPKATIVQPVERQVVVEPAPLQTPQALAPTPPPTAPPSNGAAGANAQTDLVVADPKQRVPVGEGATTDAGLQAPSAAPGGPAPTGISAAPASTTARLTVVPTTAAPDKPKAGSSIPRPLAIAGSILGTIVLPLIVLALLVVNPIALYLEGRAAGPTVAAGTASPPRLKVAAGSSATWYVQTGRSVSGLWATPGLELTLDQELPGAGRTFMVTAPRQQTWGETITIVERRGQGRANQETVVPVTFEAPASLPDTGTIVQGRITGQVTAPRLSESSQFNTTSEGVDVPVQLLVVSGPELWLDRVVNAIAMYFDPDRWLLVTIGALLSWCVLAGGAAIIFRIRRA